MSVRFFLSISSPIVRTCENHSQFWHCTTTFTPIFWTYIVEREAKKWERNHSRHRFPTPSLTWCSRLVVRCVYSVPIIFGVPMNLAPAAASMQARNWQPQEHPWNVPKESAMKVRSTSFACSFFFLRGVYQLGCFSVYFMFTQFFFAASFLGTLGPVGSLARPWLEPSNQSWRGTSAANGAIPSRNSPQVCACALWVPRPALFLSRRWLTPCALQEFRMKVEQNFYVRTFVKVRPKGFTCFTNSTPSVTCRFCVDLLCCCVHLLRCLCRCHWTLWRVLWHLDMYHLATEERVFHGPSSEFCFRLFKNV